MTKEQLLNELRLLDFDILNPKKRKLYAEIEIVGKTEIRGYDLSMRYESESILISRIGVRINNRSVIKIYCTSLTEELLREIEEVKFKISKLQKQLADLEKELEDSKKIQNV